MYYLNILDLKFYYCLLNISHKIINLNFIKNEKKNYLI